LPAQAVTRMFQLDRKGSKLRHRMNPFLGSSSGPPGGCMTPSSVSSKFSFYSFASG
jgi:hypothetical protein